jgi:hypothetical protein
MLYFFDCFGGNVEFGGKVLKCLFLLYLLVLLFDYYCKNRGGEKGKGGPFFSFHYASGRCEGNSARSHRSND